MTLKQKRKGLKIKSYPDERDDSRNYYVVYSHNKTTVKSQTCAVFNKINPAVSDLRVPKPSRRTSRGNLLMGQTMRHSEGLEGFVNAIEEIVYLQCFVPSK